uniref:FLYWCH-type domain-containing protein n=1 Tax=Anopheles coluzzii TaxID=1518534 RepID=A0A6E8VGL2_ANOCL
MELLKRSVFAESQLCGKFEGTSTKTSLMHYELRFPIDDEDGVELLETMVQCNDSVRREYVDYLRSVAKNKADIMSVFGKIFTDKAMYAYNYSGICNRGPRRKPMLKYEIFTLCMLVPLFNLMEPAIKIEEDSTDFGEFAFLSEQHLMEDITDTIKKGSSNTSKRLHSRKRKLDIAELFQLSSGNTATTGSASQRNLLEKPFPINTINELNEFDSLLLGNPSFTEKCAQMLHSVIRDEGNSLDNATCHMRLLLEHAIDYAVILRYSWYGFMPRSPAARSSGEQHPFRNLLGVISLLHRARQLRFATCSREEINEGIEKFLKPDSDDEHKFQNRDNQQPRFVTTKKGKELLIFRGYVYRVNRHRGRLRYWECASRRTKIRCSSKCTTEFNTLRSISGGKHNHPCANLEHEELEGKSNIKVLEEEMYL